MNSKPFTDKDLERLKEFKERHQYFNFPTAWDANEQYDLVNALLARLETAEKVLEAIPSGTELYPGVAADYLAWRQAAGRDDDNDE